MRDWTKVSILLLACFTSIAWFIGQGLNADNYQFFLKLRLPKALAIVLAAMAISASSLVFQTITNNRILTPSILGFDSLYLLVQVIIVVIFGMASVLVIEAIPNFLVSTAVMIGFSLTLFHFYFKRGSSNIFTLLLIGVVCGSLFNSLTGFLTMLVDPNEFAVIQRAMFASFNNINAELVYWSTIPLTLCFAYLFFSARKLDVLWLGQDNATSLGINTKRLTKQMMIVITVMVAIATALVGPVLFFGLITVSLTRELFKRFEHSFLIVASSLLAVLLLVSGQWFVEKVLTFQTTISVIINLVGGSYFMWLLLRNKIN